MVEKKAPDRILEFQFLIGRIQINSEIVKELESGLFQFLIGRIQIDRYAAGGRNGK